MTPSGRPRGRPRKYADIATAKEADRVKARHRWHQPPQSQSSRQPDLGPELEPGPESLGLETLSLNEPPQPRRHPLASLQSRTPSIQLENSIPDRRYPLRKNNSGSTQLEAIGDANNNRVPKGSRVTKDNRDSGDNTVLGDNEVCDESRVSKDGGDLSRIGTISMAGGNDQGTLLVDNNNDWIDDDNFLLDDEHDPILPLVTALPQRVIPDHIPPPYAQIPGGNSPRDADYQPLFAPGTVAESAHSSASEASIPQPSTPAGSPHPSVGQVSDPFTIMVQELVTELQTPYACSGPEHALALRKHLYKVQNHRFTRSQCSSLLDLRNLVDPTVADNNYIPHLLSRPDIHRNGRFEGLQASDIGPVPTEPVDFTQLSRDARFGHLFEGRDDVSTRPYNVCLHLHEQSRLRRPTAFSADIDSVCGFAESLAFCREGIDWFPRPHRLSNITNNLHGVYMTVRADVESEVDNNGDGDRGASHRADLYKISEIPQIALGRVFGGLRVDIFVLFPSLHYHRERMTTEPMTNFLTDQEECLWTDGVFLPSLIQFLPSSLFTEVPGSWRAATANSLASSSEQARTRDVSRHQLLSNFIPSQYCDLVWQKCIERINETPEFARFRGCRIFFNGKDFKSHTGSITYTMLDATWSRLWNSCINDAFLDDNEWWLDPGRQYSPVDKSLPTDTVDAAQHEAEIYLPKTCCIKGMHQKRTASCPKSHLHMEIYYHATLRDTCSATFTPGTESREFGLGRVYSQVYSKSKVNFVTSTVQTLSEPAMEMLALDPDFVKAVEHVGGAASVSLQTQKQVYIRSKNHAHQSLLNATRLPFGVRYEERLQAGLWKAVLRRLVALEQSAPAPVDGATPELPYYVVPSETFFGFLRGQINKFCLGFEYTLWNCSPKHTKWEQTQAAIVFLRALRHSFSTSPVQQESLLWKDSWSREGRFQPRRGRPQHRLLDGFPSQHEGLAMAVAVRRCGIGWFAPKFDWATWELKSEHAANILLENPRLLEHYRRRRGAVEDIKDVYVRLQQVGRWLARYSHDDDMTDRIADFLAHICVRQFRIDVYKILARDGVIKVSAVEDAIAGRLPLCWQTLRSVLTDGEPWLVGGNKSDIKDPTTLIDYLFDQEPFYVSRGATQKEKDRLHWDILPYRPLFHKSVELLAERIGAHRAHAWQTSFKRAILLVTTVLPYPDYNTFFSRTKARAGRGDDVEVKTRRCWMAVRLYPKDYMAALRAQDNGNGYFLGDIKGLVPKQARFVAGGNMEDDADIDGSLPPRVFWDVAWEDWLTDDGVEEYYQKLLRRRRRRELLRQQRGQQA